VLQNYFVVQDDLLVLMDKDKVNAQQRRPDEQKPTYLNLNISLDPLIQIER
jgi:hypothetical protein